MRKKILFIVNPRSGTGRHKRVPDKLKAYLDLNKYEYTICKTQYAGHATELARQAVEDGAYMVVSVGGDGTLNEVVRALVGSQTVMGIFPTGSGNGLAHHLHIPFNLKRAVYMLNEGHVENIDTISLNDRVYASIAGVGFDAYVAQKYAQVKRRGFFPYLHLVVANYLHYQPRTYILESEDKVIEVKALLISFANSSQWGFNVKISPEASVQDGLVNVTAVQKPPLPALPWLVLFLLSGNLNRINKYVKIYKFQKLKLRAEDGSDLYTHLDGDFVGMQKEVNVRMLPMSLRMALKRTY